MAYLKSEKDIEILRESGRRLAAVRQALADMVAPGVSTDALNDKALELIAATGDTPAFLGYSPSGARRPFPAAVCVSVNDEIVHGIPNEDPKILQAGDIVGLDLGLTHNGLITDSAVTVPVGHVSAEVEKLLNVTKECLAVGIKAAKAGNHIGDIGHAIEELVNGRYGIVRELGGHGVGHKVHEEPYIPNFGRAGDGPEIKVGMVLALEPMLNLGTEQITLDDDGYTFRTADRKYSAHFEHTIVITETGPEILTK